MTTLRQTNLARLAGQEFDVLVIGGGINGAVSAAALAGRGVKVALIEREDFASGVSSQSSNLAWGGIKYLESWEFLLVNKLCRSRNELMRAYPSTVKEIRFFTTIQKGFRWPPFFIFLGSVLYWIMGRFKTEPPRYVSARQLEATEPVINTEHAAGGVEYSDCYLYDNDARFVFGFVRKALDYGCVAANYVAATAMRRDRGRWLVEARDAISGETFTVAAKALVNAAGPWLDELNRGAHVPTTHHHLFSKGIHLIVNRVTDNKRVLTFFASDGRLFFLIPMGPCTCVGTTDTQVESPEVGVTDEDRDFVLRNINSLLDMDPPLTRDSIIAERCGVRPLAVSGTGGVADWVQLSRKHVVEVDRERQHLSILGGKLTDCLNVGDEVVAELARLGIEVPEPDAGWYGEPPAVVHEEYLRQARLMNLDALTDPSSSELLSERFWRRYGQSAFHLLERIREDRSCARLLIARAEYTRCEMELTAQREMVVKMEDFMRRRSKIELVLRPEDIAEAPGLRRAAEILFGAEAEHEIEEYLARLGGDQRKI
ncbi:glycerol-3-phosphate dehydrogenase/oxidase [Haliea sp. E1-2-M8]|uniref:glycerol-3-phosphate dehydrogenase/oxidase n=1 Tax=Haliea sp. E1-2-M8 TaxID=3064706 RepID=UPI00271E8DFE|nr:glycerol-3-phosphate dehydrogenase/oxidase [Haliea sp. E1-2-M8]MDO8860316.1 glycerol-3-phosphate dehydrogenase/oxidase [Haliea sp. E1-2-M8]